jgi:hypothetical protein
MTGYTSEFGSKMDDRLCGWTGSNFSNSVQESGSLSGNHCL